jgi:thiazole/oxazole-forming peptide maturase SagD family component
MPLERILKDLRKIGLSNPEEEILYITDEPKIPNFITLPNNIAKKDYHSNESYGQGYHPQEGLARIKSIAEYLERLCLDNPLSSQLIHQSFKKEDNLIDPEIFCCYSEEQLEDRNSFIKKSRSDNYLWFEVYDIIHKKRSMIPAQTVFLTGPFNDEFQLRKERISTGAALGKVGTKRAFNSGLLEAIERDACIYAYLSRKDIPRIVNLDGEPKKLEEYLSRYNLELSVFNAVSDLRAPTAISIVVDRSGIGPAVDVGSASAFTYEEAVSKSILEAVQCRRYTRLFSDIRFPNSAPKENEIFSLDQRFRYWHNLERINDLDLWLKTKNTVSYMSLRSIITNPKEILNELRRRNFNVFVADITLPEIKRKGFEVKKVIVPELHPLYLDERAKALYSLHYGTLKNDQTLKPHPLT